MAEIRSAKRLIEGPADRRAPGHCDTVFVERLR